MNQVICGDACEQMAGLPEKSVHAICFSPPYFRARRYATGAWVGGDPACQHDTIPARGGRGRSGPGAKETGGSIPDAHPARACSKCGAVHVDRQLGTEETHDCLAWARGERPCGACYVCNLREVAAACWRVLRDDGTMWVNVGDLYGRNSGGDHNTGPSSSGVSSPSREMGAAGTEQKRPPTGLKEKDLMMLPARVALALQSDGWYLRRDIIWAKATSVARRGSVKPESTADRPSTSHEYLFMFSKAERYYYDRFAVAEGVSDATNGPTGLNSPRIDERYDADFKASCMATAIGQLRSVWLFSPVPCDWEFCKSCGTLYQGPERSAIIKRYSDDAEAASRSYDNGRENRDTANLHSKFAGEKRKLVSITCPKCGGTDEAGKPPKHFVRHFAAYPATLPNLVIRAATSERGVCPTCGAPWVRVVAKRQGMHDGSTATAYGAGTSAGRLAALPQGSRQRGQEYATRFTLDADHYPAGEVDHLHDAEALNGRFSREKSPGGPRRSMAPATTGWRQSCSCPPAPPIPATVLDPFLGSGTTMLEAIRLGRRAIGIDLSKDYIAVANSRLGRLTANPLFDL